MRTSAICFKLWLSVSTGGIGSGRMFEAINGTRRDRPDACIVMCKDAPGAATDSQFTSEAH